MEQKIWPFDPQNTWLQITRVKRGQMMIISSFFFRLKLPNWHPIYLTRNW